MLMWLIFAAGMLIFFCAIILWAFWKRGRYKKEVEGKHKAIFLPEGASPYVKIVNVLDSGVELEAPKGHHCPRYFFSKETSWNTQYPENPPLGMKFVTIEIGTTWYGEDNPEPLSPYQHRPIATASMIFASIDRAFALAIGEMEQQIEEYKKKYLEAMATRLNPVLIYIMIGICVLLSGISLYFGYNHDKILKQIGEILGIVTGGK
jgi:hypothetical protein